jgi:NAD(P)-dependent dehydrogenase (short-subunit alcohol dehydrogenase family)
MTGKHAVVTGGGRGIGLAIARALAQAGANVSIISRSVPDTGDRFHRVPADLLEETQIAAAFAAARARHGPIAILINNSGIAESAPLKRTSRAMWDRIIGTNLTGAFLCSRAVIDEMLSAGYGRIINIASIAGLYGAPYISAYCASKHGLIGFSRSLAAELEGSGVTVNSVCPGYTDTEMMSRAIENIMQKSRISEREAREHLAETNPGGRIVEAQEVADAVVALCLSDATNREIILPPSSP